jgi:hypothetical protein
LGWKVPVEHDEQATAAVLPLNVPRPQLMHPRAPIPEVYMPTPQLVQVVKPVDEENWPPGQPIQAAADEVAPTSSA